MCACLCVCVRARARVCVCVCVCVCGVCAADMMAVLQWALVRIYRAIVRIYIALAVVQFCSISFILGLFCGCIGLFVHV